MSNPPPNVSKPELSGQSAGRRNIIVLLVAIVIGLLAAGSLGISFNAIMEKVRFAQMLRQIDNIVNVTRQAAITDHRLVDGNGDDLIAILNRLGQVHPTGEVGGLKTLTNPWGGATVAQTLADSQIRIETIVAPYTCRRLITLFSQNRAPDIQTVEIKDDQKVWLPIYSKDRNSPVSEAEIADGCNGSTDADLAVVVRLNP